MSTDNTFKYTMSSLQLTSLPANKRPGCYSVSLVFAIAWALIGVWFFFAVNMLPYNPTMSILILVCNTIFAAYFAYSTLRFVRQITSEYVVEIIEDEVCLLEFDKMSKSRRGSRIDLAKVSDSDYYAYHDASSLVLKAQNGTLELPLWAMPEQGEPIVKYIRNRGIKVNLVT